MDPVSIVGLLAACIQIARQGSGFVDAITNLRQRLGDATISLAGIRAQTNAVRLVADRIRDWLQVNPQLSEDQRLILRESLDACDQIISVLQEATTEANEAEQYAPRGTGTWRRIRRRTRLLMDQRRLDTYANNLSHQVNSLSLVFRMLSM
jgi:hypothetical protein